MRLLISKFLLIAFVLGALDLGAQSMSEEQKKALFLKAREDIRPVPRSSPTPRPTPRVVRTPTPKPRAKPQATPRAKPQTTPRPTSEPTQATPRPQRTPKSTPSRRATRQAEVAPTPRKPTSRSGDAPITIEKSGAAEQRGLQPAPRQGGGGWFKRYRYLTPEVRKAIDKAPVRRGRWQYIIIHNSATRQGNARIFDRYHRNVRKMRNGLAYHFVIGNGNASGNGEIEIGSRWTKQINGGHVASDYLNNIAIGICLVGDLDRDQATQAQMDATKELTDYLRNRVGRTKGKRAAVRGHKEINPRPTTCPGKRFSIPWLRRSFPD